MSEKAVFHVGDTVRFKFAVEEVTGTIKEDRGPIGVGGRRLYRVAYSLGPEFSAEIELPAADMELVRGSAPRR